MSKHLKSTAAPSSLTKRWNADVGVYKPKVDVWAVFSTRAGGPTVTMHVSGLTSVNPRYMLPVILIRGYQFYNQGDKYV